MNKIKSYIKALAPKNAWKCMHEMRMLCAGLARRNHNKRAEFRIKGKKGSLNVLFLALWDNNWKYDSLIQLMLKDERFNPLIVVCPVVNHGREYMLETLKKSSAFFVKKSYPFVCGYDEVADAYIDINQYNPDIFFYTNPYKGLIDDRYYYTQYKDVLTCYVNYFYVTMNEPWMCAEIFHRDLWRYYIEYPLLLKQINAFTKPLGINGKVSGYPLFDAFRQYKVSDNDWPIIGKRKKRIIWAPHHTISGNTGIYALSTFEKYYDFMLNMAEKFKDEIEIVFKPHPLLKPHLYVAEDWGKERTDAYYEKWATRENTAFVDGEYVGLFLASDAMIHDCNSFTVEYLAVNKPAMFLDSGKTDDKLNAVGKEARECYYKGYSEEDIERFIKDVVLGGRDELNERREAFYKNYILPPNCKLAAENIIDDLLTSLGRK